MLMATKTETNPSYSAFIYSTFRLKLSHPNLYDLDWDEERTDVHGVTSACVTGLFTSLSCNCGVTTDPRDTVEGAFAELVEHVA